MSEPARRATPADVLSALPPSPAFDRLVAAGAVPPPDLAGLRSRTALWPAAQGCATPEAWHVRRAAILAAWERELLGPMPAAPSRWSVAVADAGTRDGLRRHGLVLRWEGGALRARVLVPVAATAGGAGAVPVLLTQTSHGAWAAAAVRRGLAVCLVSAADADDDTDEHEGVVALRPPAAAGPDAPSALARRAWALSRALDGLIRVPGVDPTRAVVGGHSRNGKAALLAAAFDPRFAAVVASSSGVLGAVPLRRHADRHGGESAELLTRHFPAWFSPRLRWYAGQEHLLPTDAHELLAACAPRPVLVASGEADPVESLDALDAAVGAARSAYALLGRPDALELRVRPGGHDLGPEDVERLVDWVVEATAGPFSPGLPLEAGDAVRREDLRDELHAIAARAAPAFVPWPADAPDAVRDSAALRPAIKAALGSAPPRAPLARSGRRTPDGVAFEVHGEGPLVLWLPAGCAPTGGRPAYEDGTPVVERLVAAGLQVVTFDPLGAGARRAEGVAFAARHPGWSPLGRMVRDARGVLDALGAGTALLAGYGAGAIVAAHAAVLDERVRGTVLVAPTAEEPLLAAAPGYRLADLLAAAPTTVVDPRFDPLAPDGATAAACVLSGARHVPLVDWHRLGGPARDALVAELLALAVDRRAA